MAVSQQNNRASLLSGLRTGGVRSTSANVPHTAAPGASFNIPRFASFSRDQPINEEFDYNPETQDVFVSNRTHQGPLTSAVDSTRFSYQQSSSPQINPNALPFSPGVNVQPAQSLQMQMMQMEILRLQVSFFSYSSPDSFHLNPLFHVAGATISGRTSRPSPTSAAATTATDPTDPEPAWPI